MTATDLKKRAIALAEKTKIDSVTPEEVGQLSNDIVEYIENVEINGSSLGIRKTYTSVSAMEADSTAPKDDKGVLLRRGMLVNIYNQEDPDSADNGKVFSFQNPGWAFRGTVDAGYATKEELTELESKMATKENLKSYVTNLIYDDTSLYQYLKFVDGIKYELSPGRYENDENYFYIEIEKDNCPDVLVFKSFDNRGYKYQYYCLVKDNTVNRQTAGGDFAVILRITDFDKVQFFFQKTNEKVFIENLYKLWDKTYSELPPTVLDEYKIRGNSMLDVDNCYNDTRFNVNIDGYLQTLEGHKTYPAFIVKRDDKIWANQYYSVSFFVIDKSGLVIKYGTFKTQIGLGIPASYFQLSDYTELDGYDEVSVIITSNVDTLVITNDAPANSAEYWVTNPDLPQILGCVEEAPKDNKQYCRENGQWKEIENSGGTSLENTKTYNLFDGEITNAYIEASTGVVTPNTGYRVTTNFILCPSEGVISVKGVISGHIYCYKEDGTYIPTREQNTQGGNEPYLMFIAQKGTEKIKFEYLEKKKTGDIVIKIGGGANSLPYTEPTKQAIPYNKLQLLRSVNMLDLRYWWTDKIIDILGDSISQNPGYPYFIDLSLGTMTQWHGIGGTRISGNASNAFWQDSRINSLSDDASLIIIAGGTNDRGSYTLGDLSKDNIDTNTLCGAINVLLSKLYYRYMGMDGYYSSILYAGVNRVTERNINILFILPPKVIETNNKVIEISDDIISILNLWGIPYVDTCRLAGINEMNKLWFYKHYTDGTIIDPTHGQMPFFERISRLIVDKILQITPITDIEGVEATTKTFTVNYNNGDGYTLEAYNNSVSPVEEGGEYSVRLNILEGYDGSNAVVKSNGEVVERNDTLSGEGLDIYTVKNITQNITITVEGVIVE